MGTGHLSSPWAPLPSGTPHRVGPHCARHKLFFPGRGLFLGVLKHGYNPALPLPGFLRSSVYEAVLAVCMHVPESTCKSLPGLPSDFVTSMKRQICWLQANLIEIQQISRVLAS